MHRISAKALCLILFLFVVIDVTFPRILAVNGATPDLLAVAVIFFGLFSGIRSGIESGLVTGLIKDILSAGIFGANIIIFGALGLISGVLSERIYRDNPLIQFFISFLSAYLISGFNLTNAAYTGLAAPAVFFILNTLFIARNKLLYT